MTETTARCEIKVGFFLLRPCGRSVQQQCQRCGKWACRDHLGWLSHSDPGRTPAQAAASPRVCVDCRRMEHNSTDTRRDSRSESSRSSSSSSSSDPAWKGGGGSFAGAGAMGAWAATSANPPLPLEQSTPVQHGDPTLTPQEIAVFDQVSHADASAAKDGSFDS
ncbi:MAG: hypothetical protein HY080_10500 [Gammaproteobacteria bacterium]|nr:hypothetical protein [Gammaproteobacteria bacterium]